MPLSVSEQAKEGLGNSPSMMKGKDQEVGFRMVICLEYVPTYPVKDKNEKAGCDHYAAEGNLLTMSEAQRPLS